MVNKIVIVDKLEIHFIKGEKHSSLRSIEGDQNIIL